MLLSMVQSVYSMATITKNNPVQNAISVNIKESHLTQFGLDTSFVNDI